MIKYIFPSKDKIYINIKKRTLRHAQTQCSASLLGAAGTSLATAHQEGNKKRKKERGDSAVSRQSDILSAGAGKAHNDMRNNHGTSHQSGGVGGGRHTEARTFDTIHRARPQAGGWVGGLVMVTGGWGWEGGVGGGRSARGWGWWW